MPSTRCVCICRVLLLAEYQPVACCNKKGGLKDLEAVEGTDIVIDTPVRTLGPLVIDSNK